jgi:TolB protein
MKHLYCTIAAIAMCTLSSFAQTTWKGKITYGYIGDIKEFNLASKTDRTLFKEAHAPFVYNGDIYFISEKFPKRNYLVRKSSAATGQFKDVLDVSSDNPFYKQELDNYSVIRGTGKSGVLSSIHDPKVSPDGKFLAVTILGYKDQVFDKNCVALFELASGTLVKKFEDKYYGTWSPDGRLVMAGSHKTVSVDGNEYHSKTPGIFITDKALENPTRIDPELDDPAPYHPAVSPDGKRIAFILNNHVWVMDINGKNLKQLTAVDSDNIETYPAWSPDGKFVAAWAYKTFEKSYYTALAIVPSTTPAPIALTNKAAVWPKDLKGFRVSAGSGQMVWKF